MPETDNDIAKKAEVSHMVGILADCVDDLFYCELQGGFETMAPTFMLDHSLFTSVYVNELGERISTVVIYHRAAEVSFRSFYHDELNATPVDQAFT